MYSISRPRVYKRPPRRSTYATREGPLRARFRASYETTEKDAQAKKFELRMKVTQPKQAAGKLAFDNRKELVGETDGGEKAAGTGPGLESRKELINEGKKDPTPEVNRVTSNFPHLRRAAMRAAKEKITQQSSSNGSDDIEGVSKEGEPVKSSKRKREPAKTDGRSTRRRKE